MNGGKRVSGNELKYVQEVLGTEFASSQGSNLSKRLERQFAERFGAAFAISHINGTATMHSLLEAIGVGPGDEVIVPPLTMAATTLAVLQANATPVFADVDPRTFLIDPAAIELNVTDKTKAIIPVSLYGLSPDMEAIMAIAARHGLFVIEDNAQCFLGTYKGKLVGSRGHAASYSFQSSKHMTSGEGGMVTTNDPDIADRVRKISSLGYAGVGAAKGKISKADIQDPDYSRHVSAGWNYRLPELCAAVALGQLENLDWLVQRRIEAAAVLNDAVQGCDWLTPQLVPADCTSSYWAYTVKLDPARADWRTFRDRFLSFGGDGIYSAWKLTYLEPMFVQLSLLGRERWITDANKRKYKVGLCPVAESLQPLLLQFKTNYWAPEEAEMQADILRRTIRSFG